MHQKFLVFAMTMAAVVSVVLPVESASEPAQKIISLGPRTVGSTLAEVQDYRRDGECVVDKDYADCAFVDPKSGVRYVVFGKNVTLVVAKESAAKTPLPLGLQFGESLLSVAKKLVAAEGDRWLLTSDREGGIALSSTQDYAGQNGWVFRVELRFTGERLTEVRYSSGAI